MSPSLASKGLGVTLLGEALGANEASEGKPFVGKAGFQLSRLLEWAGFKREQFDIYNSVWCQPPSNQLEGTSYEESSISHCRSRHWGVLTQRSRVLVPMGNVPTGALLGRKGILKARGYVWEGAGQYIVPTIHPSFIQRGNARYSAAFINDIQKAVRLAQGGLQPQFTNYLLDPLPSQAYQWAGEYLNRLNENRATYLSFDIETPIGKGEDEEENESDLDASWTIERIGFSYEPLKALSIPFSPPYFATIRALLSSSGPKIVWNAAFDVPRLRRATMGINGIIHDGMVAWHILHSDLPKGLGFVATFCCPWQPAWKHLSGSKPAFYNATDADVELRCMLAIESELRRCGMWEVYQRDVIELEPILIHMQQAGMPIDEEIRLDRAIKLAAKLEVIKNGFKEIVPLEARRISRVYKSTPKDTSGLLCRAGFRLLPVCNRCGLEKPRKDHFKTFVRKQNPCAGATTSESLQPHDEYYRLAEFTPSREQMLRYHKHLQRPVLWVVDKISKKKKVSFGEKQLKELKQKYPDDLLYAAILEYRKIDKLAGTYVGRPIEA
jgi:DNA polymerase